ncbi:unnamed protein product [Parnassius apollo]|uniref:Copper transport protein n=1 Tax=Parnassius apollo TaxID=110799 RepID=A0A8S3X8K2_PARAO|nr:unnamed protein product [Parnassius apollo]
MVFFLISYVYEAKMNPAVLETTNIDLHHRHDHSHHDMDGDDSCSSPHAMTFHAGVCQEILFSAWMTTSALELFGSAVAIFLAAVLYEGLKYYREALHTRATTATGDSQVNITKNECGNQGACGGTAIVK